MRVMVRLLGPLEVHSDGQPVRISAAKERLVVVLLALDAGRVVPIGRLVDAVWGNDPPESATTSVRVLVSRLRKALAEAGCGDVIRTQSPGYLLAPELVDVDVDRFEALASQGRAQLAVGEADEAVVTLREALAIWRGDQLAESGCPELAGSAARLMEARLAALEACIEAELAGGRHSDVVGELEQSCRRHPLRERLWGQWILTLYRCGRQADALAAYQLLRTTLAEELGLDPGADLRRLEGAILAQDPKLDAPGGDVPATAGSQRSLPPTIVVPRQLPASLAMFTGRTAELARLDALADAHRGRHGVAICALCGTAGVGKTSMALSWAHQVATEFPDGQLYVNLRGFGPDRAVVEPGTALRGFLDALGVPPQRIPVSLDDQSALYRSVLAGRRVLVVLDNARDADQVRPLLPGSPPCLVVVTSRHQLTGLVANEGAEHISLDVMSIGEARELLARRLGSDRIEAEREAVDEIVALCAQLPLALAVMAARAAAYPRFTLATLARELRDSRSRLDNLTAGDQTTDVRSVLSWSYHVLSPEAARLFRLLGLHRGPDHSGDAAASLAGLPVVEVRPLLEELTRAHLTIEQAPGRYVLHDLLRAYAVEQAHSTDSPEERRGAIHRLLDHYVHTAHAATLLLDPIRDPIILAAPQTGVTIQPLTDRDHALAWFKAEQAVLLAAVEYAEGAGFDIHACQLAWCLTDYLERRALWHDKAAVWRTALAAADRMGDAAMQTRGHRYVADACTSLDSLEDAHAHLTQALEISTRAADRRGQADVHLYFSWWWERMERYAQALESARMAIQLYTAVGHRRGSATALNAVGWFHARLGRYQMSVEACEQAMAMHRDHHDRDGEAESLDCLGYAHHHLGHLTEAIDCYQRAIDLFRTVGSRYDEASILAYMGDTFLALGDPAAARSAWEQALVDLDELGHAEADEIRERLHRRDHPAPPLAARINVE